MASYFVITSMNFKTVGSYIQVGSKKVNTTWAAFTNTWGLLHHYSLCILVTYKIFFSQDLYFVFQNFILFSRERERGKEEGRSRGGRKGGGRKEVGEREG